MPSEGPSDDPGARTHRVRVGPLPGFVPVDALLGPGDWSAHDGGYVMANLRRADAADLQARLRKLVIDGHPMAVEVSPGLPRGAVREARAAEARRHRATSPGFELGGTRVDAEGRWSLTPEALANRMGEAAAGRTVLDAGCGAGGNAIGFARAGCEVVAVERDEHRLDMARHNARRYGVVDRIRFVHGDAETALRTELADLAFVDPPWGTDWSRPGVGLGAFPLLGAAVRAAGRFEAVWAKLPPSFDTSTLPGAEVEPLFGVGLGDARRLKFLWLRLSPGRRAFL